MKIVPGDLTDLFPMARPGLVGHEFTWMRFDRYELLERNDEIMIIPTKGALPIHYRPMHEPEILIDFLKLGKFMMDESHAIEDYPKLQSHPRKLRIANRVMQFCTRYGLLGMFYAGENYLVSSKGGRYIWSEDQNGRISKQTLTKFAAEYFPHGVPKGPIDKWRTDADVAQGYAENAIRIALLAYSILLEAMIVKKASTEATYYLSMGGDRRLLDVWPMRCCADVVLIPDAKPRLDFWTRSLQDALRIMIVLSITSSDKQFRLCDECGTPFMMKDPRARFCGDRCSTRSRQRRFLANHKKAKEAAKKPGVKLGVEFSPKPAKSQGKSRKPIKRQNPRQ
jgi:hypothetical protein